MSRHFTITLHVELTDPRFPTKEEAFHSYSMDPIPIVKMQGSILGDCHCEQVLNLQRVIDPYLVYMGRPDVKAIMHHMIEAGMREAIHAMMQKVVV